MKLPKIKIPRAKINLRKIYLVAVPLILVALTLPSFNFKVGDNEINFQGIDLSFISPTFKLGEFRKGDGVYESTKYQTTVSFDERLFEDQRNIEFKNILNTIEKRKVLAGLYDVDINGRVENSTYYIDVTLPEYYVDESLITQLLVGKGTIGFTKNVQDEAAPDVSLTVDDVEGVVGTTFSETYGSVLEFRFKESVLLELTISASTSSGYFLMTVDNVLYAITRNPIAATSVFAVPFAEVQSSESAFVLNRIVKSYFGTNELSTSITFNPDVVENVKPEYRNDRIRNGVYAFAIVLALLIVGFLMYRSRRNSAKFILIFATFIGIYVTILKLSYATLSIELVLGSAMALVFFGNLIFSFITSIYTQDDLEVLKAQRLLSLGILLLSFVVYRMVFSLAGLVDLIGGLTIGSIAYLIISYIYLNIIKDEDIF